jgi:hypothetical protein
MAALRTMAAEKSEVHRRQFVGRELDAITLHTPAALQAESKTAALTDNFLPLEINEALPANRLIRLMICGVNADLTLQGGVGELHAVPKAAMAASA